MKIPACLLTLVSVAVLGLVATLPGLARAADMGVSGTTTTPTSDNASLPGRYRTPAQPQNAVPNENYRADYFVDYHAKPDGTATQGIEGGQHDSPANIRESIGGRDRPSQSRNPFEGDLSRFRGEMSTWRR